MRDEQGFFLGAVISAFGAGGEVGRGAGAKPGEGRSERKD